MNKRKRGTGRIKVCLDDVINRIDHVADLCRTQKVLKPEHVLHVSIARSWVDTLRGFRADYELFTYEPSPKYKCVGFSFVAADGDGKSRTVSIKGFPVWESSAFVSLSWCQKVLDQHNSMPEAVLGDFAVLHLAIDAPSANPDNLLFLTRSRAWNLVASLHLFLVCHRRALGGDAMSTVASLRLVFAADAAADQVDDDVGLHGVVPCEGQAWRLPDPLSFRFM